MKKVGALIPPLLKGLGLEEAVRFEEIRREWPTIVREPLSLHMSPSALKNGELLIVVDSPVWLQQVSLLKADVIKLMSPFGVKEVRFRIGRVTAVRRRPERTAPRRKRSLDPDTVREIDDTVSGLEDITLRESIRRAMEQSLRSSPGHEKPGGRP